MFRFFFFLCVYTNILILFLQSAECNLFLGGCKCNSTWEGWLDGFLISLDLSGLTIAQVDRYVDIIGTCTDLLMVLNLNR